MSDVKTPDTYRITLEGVEGGYRVSREILLTATSASLAFKLAKAYIARRYGARASVFVSTVNREGC